MRRALTLAAIGTALLVPGPADAHDGLHLPVMNDLFALGEGSGQTPAPAPIQRPPGPPLKAAPQVDCDEDSRPEPGIQGRVPEGSARQGLWCNLRQLGHQGVNGGFKVYRYADAAGHECAYYDTALLYPFNAFQPGNSQGVVVLDVSDPRQPVETDRLLELPALSPHESLNLNRRRGLLAAVNGNPLTAPGMVAIWDVSRDCRHPVLRSQGLHARFGHESGFSHDGRTFYATSTALPQITALDISDPAQPDPIWVGNLISHGMSLSRSGNRAYVADATGANMLILDTSEIQARKRDPRAREVSRITWPRSSIPQNAIPFRKDGGRYVLEIDEYTAAAGGTGGEEHDVGAARIIDIADERHPRVASNLRLEVNQPEDHRLAAAEDPGNMNPLQGYAAHYCSISSPVDPDVVACSFIASGLRVFDISRLERPREIAYFVAPTKARYETFGQPSNYAMSKPVVVPRRREVWFSDGASGFYTLRVDRSVWPR